MKKISSSANIVGILLVLAILLSGCQAGTSSTAVSGRQSSLYTTTPKPDPSKTADIVLGIVADPNASVNPIYCTTRDVMNINTLVFESVVELDGSMKPVPLLADRWEISEENIWTFTLRSGIVFHDGVLCVSAIPTQHCPNSYAYLVESEEKRVLFTGDLKHPTIDFPSVAFEEELDLIVVEGTHVPTDQTEKALEKAKTKRVLHHHISPVRDADMAQMAMHPHHYQYGKAFDGMEIIL